MSFQTWAWVHFSMLILNLLLAIVFHPLFLFGIIVPAIGVQYNLHLLRKGYQ